MKQFSFSDADGWSEPGEDHLLRISGTGTMNHVIRLTEEELRALTKECVARQDYALWNRGKS